MCSERASELHVADSIENHMEYDTFSIWCTTEQYEKDGKKRHSDWVDSNFYAVWRQTNTLVYCFSPANYSSSFLTTHVYVSCAKLADRSEWRLFRSSQRHFLLWLLTLSKNKIVKNCCNKAIKLKNCFRPFDNFHWMHTNLTDLGVVYAVLVIATRCLKNPY